MTEREIRRMLERSLRDSFCNANNRVDSIKSQIAFLELELKRAQEDLQEAAERLDSYENKLN